MEKKNLIGAIVVGVLALFGVGTGVKRHNRRKRELEEKQKERDDLLQTVQKNQIELEKSQQETVRMLYVLQSELGVDPTKINTDIE